MRQRARDVMSLINDPERLTSARETRVIDQRPSVNAGSRRSSFNQRHVANGDEEEELRRAIEESKRTAAIERFRRQGFV